MTKKVQDGIYELHKGFYQCSIIGTQGITFISDAPNDSLLLVFGKEVKIVRKGTGTLLLVCRVVRLNRFYCTPSFCNPKKVMNWQAITKHVLRKGTREYKPLVYRHFKHILWDLFSVGLTFCGLIIRRHFVLISGYEGI